MKKALLFVSVVLLCGFSARKPAYSLTLGCEVPTGCIMGCADKMYEAVERTRQADGTWKAGKSYSCWAIDPAARKQ